MTLTTTALELPCGKCGQPVRAEIIEPRIMNARDVSSIVILHDLTVQCAACGQTNAMMLSGVQGYIFRLVPVQPVERPGGILLPGNGFKI